MISLRNRVYIASPYRTSNMREAYDRYLIQCLDDSISKGEAPYAPHIYLPQCKLCDDSDRAGRNRGLEIGRKFLSVCNLVAVYKDFGISDGMIEEADYAKSLKIPVIYRNIL